MTKLNLSASFIMEFLLEILESHSSDTLFSRCLNILCLVCYFFQILGYLAKIGLNYYDTKLTFLLNFFYYTNLANFLNIFRSKELVIVVYTAVVCITLAFYLYLSLIAILKLYFKFHWKSHFFFKICNTIAANFFRIYFWILFVPFLEVLVDPFSCASGSFLPCGSEFPPVLWVISAFVIALSILMGFLHLVLNCNCKFLDLMQIRLGLNIFSLAAFGLRCIVPLSFFLFGQQNYILIVLMHSFAATHIINYLETFHIRSPTLNPLFFSLLLSFEVVVMVVTFWKYFGVLLEESVFYLIMIGFVFSFKAGWNFFFHKRFNIHLSNFSAKGFIDYGLEELFYLFNNSSGSTSNFFLLSGVLQYHAKACENPICKLKSKTMKKFQELPLKRRSKIVDSFILQRFKKEIEEQSKLKTTANEILVIKYIGYLINSNCNTSKAFYETQKIKLFYTRRSFIGKILLSGLVRDVEKKIRDIEREKIISERKALEETLEVSSFFRIYRQKISLESKMKKLLEQKISFWDAYKEGFESYDHLAKNIYSYLDNANRLQKIIEELLNVHVVQHEKIALFRLMSIYHCIILNQLPEALEFEERIDIIRKRFLHVDKQALSPLVFLRDNLVVCESSFLNNDGKILESSKTEKLARFFGYSIQDVKLLTSIDSLMPQFIAENHNKLIFWSFVRTRKEQISYEWEIVTHAVDKQGFLFPIKLIIGYNFHHTDDYVANAGIMKLQEHGYEEVLIGPSGDVLGFNREFFDFFKKDFPVLEPKQLQGLCLFCLMPRLKDLIEKEGIFKDKKTISMRNQIISLAISYNFMDIIELVSFYGLENEALENPNSRQNSKTGYFSSNTTMRTNRSTDSNNKNRSTGALRSMKQNKDLMIRVNNFINKLDSLKPKRELIMSLFQEQTLTSEKLINKLLESQPVIKYKCVLDLSFKYHRYGKTANQVISIGQLVFMKISLIESEAQTLKSHHVEESMISDNMGRPIILPPQNQAEFGIEFERLIMTNRSQPNATDANFHLNNDSFDHNNDLPKFPKKSLDVKFNLLDGREKLNSGLPNILQSVQSEEGNGGAPKLIVDPPEIPQKESIRSSLQSSEHRNRRRQENKIQTTEQMALKDLEFQASQSSTSSTAKAGFNILTIVGMLRKTLPKAIYRLNLLLGLQMMLILSFCVVYYILAGQYISNTYIPLKTTLTNQLITNVAFTIVSTTFVNLENQILGFKNLSDFELNEMFVILEQKTKAATLVFYEDRNSNDVYDFSNYLQTWRLTYVDGLTFKAQNILIVDETDIFLDVLNNALEIRNLNSMKELVKIIPRNYIDYLVSTKLLRDLMLSEFLISNKGVTNQLLTVLIFAVITVFLCKLIEFALLSGFYAKVTRLLNIFLRNSAKEAINETLFLKETLESIKDQTKTFLAICYSERLINKKNYAIQLEDEAQENAKKKEKQLRKEKKTRLKAIKTRSAIASLRPFSRTKIYLFLLGSGGTLILYFAFNYYFWTNCNQSINDLLSRTEVFNNIYVYSATTAAFNNLLLREFIKRDPEYEESNAKSQIHENRFTQLISLLDSRTKALDSYVSQLPTYILLAESQINDRMFTEVVGGDLCMVLEYQGIISSIEKDHCYNYFNGAMTKGIFGGLNQYINLIKSIRWLCNYTGLITDDQIAQRASDIKNFIQSQTYSEIVIGSVFLNDAVMVFYNYFSQFYLKELYASINQLTIFVWIMCAACLTGIALLLIHTWITNKRMYGLATGSLGLIPLEKLSFDEQTIFLIKNFYKDQV